MSDYREKLESIGFRARVPRPKVTTDVHDAHKVDVTEHWHDQVDVTVKPDALKVRIGTTSP